MARILAGEDVLRYFPRSEPPPRDRVERMVQGLIDHWQERGYGLWAVEDRSSGELLGRCGLQYLPDTDEVEVDFILDRDCWSQGYATEAGRASVRFGFQELGVDQIVGIVHTGNRASQRVLEKLGMVRIEQREFFGMDCYRYAIDRAGFEERTQSSVRRTATPGFRTGGPDEVVV
jgi:ribosomal-protein-alanine N-acetyltransferase